MRYVCANHLDSFKQPQPNFLVNDEIAIKAIDIGPPIGPDKHTRTMRTSVYVTHFLITLTSAQMASCNSTISSLRRTIAPANSVYGSSIYGGRIM